jgi:hypothetical protein
VTPLAAAGLGGAAGLFGAALAHALTTLADRAGCAGWLHGPFGPRFFLVALYTGVFYAVIGGAARRKSADAALGFGGTFLGIAVPLFVLTRYGGWGMAEGSLPTTMWQKAFVAVYVLSVWGTIAALGAAAGGAGRLRGVAAAMGGSLAAYVLLSAALRLFPKLTSAPWSPASFFASPVNLLDGLLSGAGLCLALTLDARIASRRHS